MRDETGVLDAVPRAVAKPHFFICIVRRYAIHGTMIVSFRHKVLETFYRTGSIRGIQGAHSPKIARILFALDNATTPEEMPLPGYRLHSLKGKLNGHWSVWVNGNWRITFRFVGTDVELVDYH